MIIVMVVSAIDIGLNSPCAAHSRAGCFIGELRAYSKIKFRIIYFVISLPHLLLVLFAGRAFDQPARREMSICSADSDGECLRSAGAARSMCYEYDIFV